MRDYFLIAAIIIPSIVLGFLVSFLTIFMSDYFLSVGIIIPSIVLGFLVSLLTLLRSFKNLFKNLLFLMCVICGIYISLLLLNRELNIPFNYLIDLETTYVYSYFIWLLIKYFQYGFFVINLFPCWVGMEDFKKTIENNISDKTSRGLYFLERIFYMPMIWGIGFIQCMVALIIGTLYFITKFLYKTICGKF